ncbi:serine protease inhibitor Kazal-type 13 [Tursiops truncatus]|uniref:Serine protease inhibitor Kazal-type 13 n=1 Tax=Tursiops truncatus TaxID=9739 RepID=A0A2U4AHD9_TURTR|nr:serine protease inhibitor Kazal-type 13 [Tursiops truncatus]
MAAFPCMTIFFLVSSTLAQIVFSDPGPFEVCSYSVTSVSEIKLHGELFLLTYCVCTLFAEIFKPHDYSKWPMPPCKMYYPLDPLYDANCPEVTAYVCATNGHTYKNECLLCVDQWEFGPYIEFDKYRKCD